MAENNAGTPPGNMTSPAQAPSPANGDARTAPAATKPVQRPRTANPAPETKDSFREIVETVVFVVVLVLLLKAFVAEAFVIPTGSMATTLYGYQKMVRCPKCSEEFPVNCSCESDPKQGRPVPVVGCICPNCYFPIDFSKDQFNPACSTGDRVLVGKYFYDLNLFGLDSPRRYQVVVFKYPENPQQNYEAMNYIKRAIGMPGETIAIHYGKLFVYQGLSFDDSNVPPLDLWKKEHMHQDDEKAETLFQQGAFTILRKPPAQILAERRIVYDNDHQASDLFGKVKPRWWPEADNSAWKPDNDQQPKRFEHAAREGNDLAWLRYHHLVPDIDRNRSRAKPELISDFMGYNTWLDERQNHAPPPKNWVGDLMLECDAEISQAQGELVLELSKGVDRFQARWELSSGLCTLLRLTKDGEEKLDSKPTSLKRPGKYRLRFANVDQRLVLWVDQALPFGDGVSYVAPHDLGPSEKNDLEPASIGVRGGGVTVAGLKLWRDTYYTGNVDFAAAADGGPGVDLSDPTTWDPLRHLKARTYYVQPDHFLCLGDNSPESSDGRTWGTVPRRLFLGRALQIYWPLNRFSRIE